MLLVYIYVRESHLGPLELRITETRYTTKTVRCKLLKNRVTLNETASREL